MISAPNGPISSARFVRKRARASVWFCPDATPKRWAPIWRKSAPAVDPGAHAVLIVDRAGWHTTAKLRPPENITILPLPSKAPELNPVENVWQFMRDNWLSNRIFESYDQIVDLCCDAWNRLRDQPWRIMSIGLRDWAHA